MSDMEKRGEKELGHERSIVDSSIPYIAGPAVVGAVVLLLSAQAIVGGSYSLLSVLFFAATALSVGLALSVRRNRQIEGYVDYVDRRLEAFPASESENAPLDLPEEFRAIDERLERLQNRFCRMRPERSSDPESPDDSRGMKTQFFAVMSHDLRSPLNSIIGFTDLLLKDMEGPLTSEQRKPLLEMAEEAEKLVVLIADILDTSKLEAGEFELDRSEAPPAEVLDDCVSEALRLVGTRSIEIKSDFQPDLPLVYMDKVRVRQALVSLIGRVLSEVESGSFELKASVGPAGKENEKRLRIDIVDSGRIVSKEGKERIKAALEPFEGVSQRTGSGLSLGIALARDIVRLHGGNLEVFEETRGETALSVVLPLDGPPETA